MVLQDPPPPRLRARTARRTKVRVPCPPLSLPHLICMYSEIQQRRSSLNCPLTALRGDPAPPRGFRRVRAIQPLIGLFKAKSPHLTSNAGFRCSNSVFPCPNMSALEPLLEIAAQNAPRTRTVSATDNGTEKNAGTRAVRSGCSMENEMFRPSRIAPTTFPQRSDAASLTACSTGAAGPCRGSRSSPPRSKVGPPFPSGDFPRSPYRMKSDTPAGETYRSS